MWFIIILICFIGMVGFLIYRRRTDFMEHQHPLWFELIEMIPAVFFGVAIGAAITK